MSNHLLHGLVALDGLGAPAQRLSEFTEMYTKDLEPARRKGDPVVSKDEWLMLRGKREKFIELAEFFDNAQKGREKKVGSV